MNTGFPIQVPTPLEAYASLPYKHPLIDFQPVVRVPIAGPSPFNTLVIVRGKVFTSRYRHADGKLERRKVALGTHFRLVGFDPRMVPSFAHSTSVALQMMQTSGESAFVTAVDTIDGQFDSYGNWTIVATVADLWNNQFAVSSAYVSSWVLCFEPPIENTRGNKSKTLLVHPPSSWIVEQAMSASSTSDIEFERLIKRSQQKRLMDTVQTKRQGIDPVKLDAQLKKSHS